MKKRVLSLFMALMLCLTLLPTAVFADVTENGEGSGGTHYVAESGGTQYETVQEILDNMEEGEITLLGNVTENLAVSAATTIHMNGHSITGNIDATDSLTLNGGTVDGTVKVDGGTLNMTAPSDAAAAIDGGLNVVSGSASVSGAKVGVKGTLYFDGTDMLISGAVKAVELDSAAEPAAKTLYGSATVNGDTAAEAGFDTDTYKVGGEIAKKLTNKQVGSTTPAAPSLTLTETSKSLTAGKTAVFTANYTGTGTLNAYVQANAVNGYFTISQKNNGDGTYTVSVKIDEETPGGTYTLFVHEVGNTSVQASATITVIGLPDAAEVNGKQYKSLPRALNAAQNGDTVKLLANHVTDTDALNALGEDFTLEQYASIVPVVTKTLTLDLNHKTVDYLEVGFTETNEETQKKETLATGNLTVTGEGAYGRISNLMFMAGALDIRSGEIGGSEGAGLVCDVNSGTAAISNGTVYGLTVMEGASVTVKGGSNHAGEWVVDSGATLNITDGTFGDVQFTHNGTIAISGGTFKSIKSYIAEELQPLMSLLDTQKVHAFYKGDDVQDGNATELADVTVKEHTHTMANNKCACGFSCTHTNTEGASTIGKDGKCTTCGTQFAAGIGETYYTDVKSALDAAADGQTVRLLANGMLPDDIYVSKTLTLDLNGHSLDGYSLKVGGLTATSQVRTGKLTVIDSSGGNGAVGVTVRDGGKVEFRGSVATSCLQLQVYGGDVKFYGGNIRSFELHNDVAYADFLPKGYCYYNYSGSGSDLGSIVTAADVASVVSAGRYLAVAPCSHGGANGFDINALTCPYCGAPAVAETALNNGEGNRPQRRFADLQTALDADRYGGATLQLLADVTGDYTIDGTKVTGLDLNGHSIKGTVRVKGIKGDRITTTLSNTKNTTTASIDEVVAFDGAELAGSKYPAVIGTLTLAEGATWKNILNDTALGYKVLNADGTHKWYARDDVNGSQLNNVIINRLPITSKTLNLKVDGKNLTGSSPKVERGTTVQLCASCNTNGATVEFSILKKGETTPITLTKPSYADRKYTKDYSFDTIGEYTIYFTATKDGYTVTSRPKTLSVTKAAIPASAITAPAANALTYNGSEQVLATRGSVDAKYGEMQYRLGTNGSFSTAIPTATDAGTYTVYYKVVGAEGYNDTTAQSIKVTIGPVKIKDIGNVDSVSKTYDGSASVTLPKTNLAFLDTAASKIFLPESAYTITDARFTARQDNFYEDSPNAGTKEAISFTLTLTDSNYVFEGEAANVRSANFNFASNDDRFQINQATVSPAEITLFVYNDVAKTYTLNLATLLPELTSGCEYGKIKYQGCDYHFTDSTYLDSNNGMFVSNDGILTLPIVAAHSADVNKQIGTITAPVVTANYQQFELTIKVVIGEKITPVKSADFKISATGIIYRQTLENSTLTVEGTMKDPTTGKEVKGTFAWKDESDFPIQTGDVYFDWTFTPAEGYEEYAAVTDIVKVPVAPKSINGATITLEKYEFAYNAAEQSPKITGVTLDNWDETRITYVIKSGDKATDANDSITLTIEGTGNYTGKATVEWKITPREVTPTIEVASCTYTGDALEPTVTVKDDIGNIIDQKEYEIFYSNNTNAGIATVTIKDVEGGNYVLSEANKTFEITKAAAPAAEAGSLTITNGTQLTYTYDFKQLLPEAPNGDYGTVRYDLGNRQTAINFTAHGYYLDPEIAEFEGSKLTLVGLYAKDGTATGQIGTVKVNVTTTNYENFQLTLVLNAVNQIKPTPDGKITASNITYGQALSDSSITGKMKDPNTGATVNGTFTWTDGTINPNAGSYEAEWTFTPAAGYEKYATATGTVTIKVNKATPTFTAPTAQENLTYTGQEQALITASSVTSGGTMQYSLTENGTYSQDTPTGTDAGAYTVWYRVIGDENHNDTAPASVAVSIRQKPLTITEVTTASKPYDGTTNAGITSVTFDNVTLTRDTDYTVTASFDDAGVGSGKNVTATVTLMGQTAKNYFLEQSSFPTTGSIIKAAAPDFTRETALTIVNGHEKTYTVTLPALPTLETPKEYGALTYEIGEIKLNDGYYTSGAKVENGELTLPIQKNDVETTGSVGTVTVVIKSANYEDITLTVNVSAKNRITPTGTPTLSKNAIIYGDALNTIALSGKLHDNVNNVDVDGTFEWVDGTHIPVVGNGTYAAEWIFEPTDTEKYLTVSGRSNITVEKARQYGKLSMAGYTYGKTPSTPTLTDQTGDLNAQVTYSYAAADSGSVQTWDISNPPALNAGTYRMYASIGDTDNYYGFEAVYCEFVVAKATPTYTVPTGLTAKYGQTLADVTLPDGWSWMDSSESVGGASTAAKTFQAKFTPKDTENYNTVENIELEVTVNKADGGNLKTVELEQKYTDASDHTYTPDWLELPSGQTWSYTSEYSVSTGSGAALTQHDFAADGSLLTYAVSGGNAGDKITITLKASCNNYEDFTITLTITLTEKDNQQALRITGGTTVVYGQTLQLGTSGGSGSGAVTYTVTNGTGEATIDSNGVLTPIRIGSVTVTATKAGDSEYNAVTSSPVEITITKATPTGEPAYTKITASGKTLADAALGIGTITPAGGTIAWDDPTTTEVVANKSYGWTYTPTDSTNYESINGSIKLWNKSTSSGGGSYYAPVVPDMPMVYWGCTGDAVKTLQEKLNAKGFDSGNVDGIFGAKTYAAVTAFQKANGLGVDGIVGKLTWGKLYGVSPAMPVETTTVVGRPMVSYGSRGDAVRKLQELLNALGYDCGSVDGIFGSKTKAAVLAFQKANGLGADGIVGPLTWGKLV